MKARIPSDPLLSVCIIVKNEEVRLRACLESLTPLFRSVRCELIIVDTGSSDNTMAIAGQYTKSVFPYPLEGEFDFAAAKGFAVSKATGEWMLSINAQETVPDTIGLALFLQSAAAKSVKTAACTVRRYTDGHCRSYVDCSSVRLCRTCLCSFTGAHGQLEPDATLRDINLTLENFEYINLPPEELEKELGLRRAPLEAALKNEPKNTRLLILTADLLGPREALQHLERARLLENKRKGELLGAVYSRLIARYSALGNWAMAEKTAAQHIKLCPETLNSAAGVDIFGSLVVSCYFLGQYAKSAEAYSSYFELYGNYKKRESDAGEALCYPLRMVTRACFDSSTIFAVRSLGALSRYDEALGLVDALDFEHTPSLTACSAVEELFALVFEAKQEKYLLSWYLAVLKSKSGDRIELFTAALEHYYLSHPSRREELALLFVGCRSALCKASSLCGALALTLSEGYDNFSAGLQAFVNTPRRWGSGCAMAVFLALKNGCDISPIISSGRGEELEAQLDAMFSGYPSLPEVLLAYPHLPRLAQSVPGLHWLTAAFERSALRTSAAGSDSRFAVVRAFLDYLIIYISTVYVEELLNPEDMPALPELHRFGYYMGIARLLRSEGDPIGCLRNVREALKNCERMGAISAAILRDFNG